MRCIDVCPAYETAECEKLKKPPYVCNGCGKKTHCLMPRMFYSSKYAHDEYRSVLVDSRVGINQTPESIQKAAVLAVYSGADFIKTSTGKGYPGATPEAVYTMCQVLKKYHSITGKRVGIKVAGGVRTAEEAVRYYTIVKEVLGNDWLNKDLFRIGASSLVEDIEHRLGK